MHAWLAARLPQVWLRRGWPALMLWPLSQLYALVTALRRSLYRLHLLRVTRLPVPVIVVGNVVTGGSGKTPVVMAIVNHLRAAGWQVGVVSRGYGRSTDGCREVLADSAASEVGDEPALIRRVCEVPVFVASKRADAARALLAAHRGVQVIVCDDGLQHLALARDIEVCVFDDRGTGNGFLLPAGPLREHWPRPAHLVVHTGRQPSFAGWHVPRALAAEALRADGTRLALAALADTPVTAVAAIAKPDAFFDMLRAAGVHVGLAIPLPDHFDLTHWHAPADAPPVLLCTEKDAVKLWKSTPEAWAVPLRLDTAPGLLEALDRLLAQVPSRISPPTGLPHGQQTS